MIIDHSVLLELCQVARVAATEAGQYIQSKFDQTYVKKGKIGGDSLASQVVTEVDLQAQEIILGHLRSSIQCFDLGLLTEEAIDDASRGVKDYFWCIDPMDGTLPFTEHRTGYAVSIALLSKEGDPVVGVVYVPDKEVCYAAVKGNGVQLNGDHFTRRQVKRDRTLHVYMDRSFQSEPYFYFVAKQLEKYSEHQGVIVAYHADFGGVRNALGVITSGQGCYVKFPKKSNGCGSIWDYAATRLLAEELRVHVSNADGNRLHLNQPDTTFMNQQGILYATDKALADYLIALGREVHEYVH